MSMDSQGVTAVGSSPQSQDRAAGTPRARIELRDVSHSYVDHDSGAHVLAVDDVSVTIYDGELMVILGPSGCGKSTILNMIAGFIHPTSGRVMIDGQDVTGPGPDRGVVFQELGVLPWLTVARNVGHGPRIQKKSKAERQELTQRFIKLVNLEGFENKYPHQLSGGMKQRVAVARALAADPKILLMDEPFAAVDAQTRWTLQQELLRIADATHKTIIFITHSVEEAMLLGDRVLVLTPRPGRIKEIVQVPSNRNQRSLALLRDDEAMRDCHRRVLEMVRGDTE